MGELSVNEPKEQASTEQPSQPVIEVQKSDTAVCSVPSKPTQILGIGSPGWFGTIILCIFISVASSALTLWIYDKKYATKIVAVDLKGYVDAKANDFASGKITQEETSKAILQMGDLIKNIPSNTVVISADVAVRNIETIKPQ